MDNATKELLVEITKLQSKKLYKTDADSPEIRVTAEGEGFFLPQSEEIQRKETARKAALLVQEYISLKSYILDVHLNQMFSGNHSEAQRKALRKTLDGEMQEVFCEALAHISVLNNTASAALSKDVALKDLRRVMEVIEARLTHYRPHFAAHAVQKKHDLLNTLLVAPVSAH